MSRLYSNSFCANAPNNKKTLHMLENIDIHWDLPKKPPRKKSTPPAPHDRTSTIFWLESFFYYTHTLPFPTAQLLPKSADNPIFQDTAVEPSTINIDLINHYRQPSINCNVF